MTENQPIKTGVAIPEQPAKSSRVTEGNNTSVIKPESRVNKREDVGQVIQQPNERLIPTDPPRPPGGIKEWA